MTRKRLAVIGAGPKGVSLAAKSRVLHDLGVDAPEVILIDSIGVAAHWTGEHGYTNGEQPLGTPPQKDVGFPYSSDCWGDQAINREVSARMLQFSWQAFLMKTRTTRNNNFAAWVDRGLRAPRHSEWGEYIKWVADEVGAELVGGTVNTIKIENDQWAINVDGSSGDAQVIADGLVVTGPGPATDLAGVNGTHGPRITDGRRFWQQIDSMRAQSGRILACIIGAGETAASVAVALASTFGSECMIDVISKQGVIYSRGESYDENRYYSDPEIWETLDEVRKAEFIKRTDRAVFSIAAKKALDGAEFLQTLSGEVARIERLENNVRIHLKEGDARDYDYVVAATGFNPMWWLSRLDENARDVLRGALGDGEVTMDSITRNIGRSLEVEGVTPTLHLPMLSGLRQGPGFPNLSSLGLLADRVLSGYVQQ